MNMNIVKSEIVSTLYLHYKLDSTSKTIENIFQNRLLFNFLSLDRTNSF